jgi:hypothetical protein
LCFNGSWLRIRLIASARVNPVAAVQPSDLGGAICGDDDDLVHACVDTGLEEERHVVHDDCLRILAAGRLSQSGLLPRDARMNDLFQAAQLCRPSEDEGP